MSVFDKVINWNPIARIRKNHALEHATLQVLTSKQKIGRMAGYSDQHGFWVVGDVSTDVLNQAANEALARLRAGEWQLAIHPNCGTNFAFSGLLAGSLGWVAMLGSDKGLRSKLDRWPIMVAFVTLGLMIAQPLGPKIQEKFTTNSNPGEMEIVEITRYTREDMPLHRIRTRN